MYRSIFILCVLVSSVLACTPQETKFVNLTAKLYNVEPTSSSAVKHTIGGTIKITSGCSFQVRNLTIIPSVNAYWWGIPVPPTNSTTNVTKNGISPLDPVPRIVDAALGSYNGQTVTFFLNSQWSFADFQIIELHSELGDYQGPLGAWSITGDVPSYYKLSSGATLPGNPETPWVPNGGMRFKALCSGWILLYAVVFVYIINVV